ncbi:Ras and Rab interactor 3 [Nibea albiflora]|uniref:Ras and Rab interactor 3 n=1 Tax=Nibea albiflora TaxID=240163 RepID=A0ACB7FK67_NIBAL|nr:Ras and Rab interactor 3 [Nibea albiflora]
MTSPLTGTLDTPAVLSIASLPPSTPLSPPSLPSSLPPARPCRPKPPPPTAKSSQVPPLLPSTPPSLPPPLPPASKSLVPASNPPFPSLPPPLSPTPVSPTALISLQPTVSSDPSCTPLPPVLSPTTTSSSPSSPPPPVPPLNPPSTPTPPLLSPIDQLIGSASVWQPKGLSQDQTTNIMEKEMAGVFLVHSKEDKGLTLSVRLPDEQGPPLVHKLTVKQHKKCTDILAIPLRLPKAITTATKREELEVISAMGADFWTSNLNQQAQNKDLDENHSGPCLYVNPVTVEESPDKVLNHSSTSKPDIIPNQNISSSLQNGEAPQKASPEVKGPAKITPNQEMKYKRPPPRPPSLASSSGMGLLFSSSSSHHTSSSVPPAAERKEEGRGGVGEREERKSMSTSPPPSRPPVPLQSRAAPPLPPAPLRRTSSRKSTDRDAGEGREREKGQNPAKRVGGGERGEEKTVSKSGLLSEGAEQEDSSQHPEEEVKKDREKREKEDEKQEKEMATDKEDDKQKSSPQCPSLVKKPTRPVPPPRRKPCTPETPVCPNQAGGGSTNQSVGSGPRVPPPSPARRPDVSLYSPQGGAVLGTDPDSCSTSSTEEEGEGTQEQEQNHNRPAGSRSPKVSVRRTPTTVMLDRARYRLSTVLTGLISHDRRLTQRIVELARDPLSYFGNLVKEHRAFTLETMSNHSSSTELLQEIRQMVTQLKSYLLQSTELQAMLEPQHQYAQDKLESIAEAALCKSVLKPLRGPIYQCLEELHTNNSSLKQLAQNQSVVLGSTTTALGITTAVPEAPAMEKISLKLNKLHLEYSPQKKIELLLKACKIIYDSMSVSSPVCCPEIGTNPKTLGVLPTTTIEQLAEQCAARFEEDSYILSVYTDGVHRPLAPTELAVSVKSSCQPGSYCFVYHPIDQPKNNQPGRSCPTDPPPAPPAESLLLPAVDTVEQEAEEESLISL